APAVEVGNLVAPVRGGAWNLPVALERLRGRIEVVNFKGCMMRPAARAFNEFGKHAVAPFGLDQLDLQLAASTRAGQRQPDSLRGNWRSPKKRGANAGRPNARHQRRDCARAPS